jgi:hypothetical protein
MLTSRTHLLLLVGITLAPCARSTPEFLEEVKKRNLRIDLVRDAQP